MYCFVKKQKQFWERAIPVSTLIICLFCISLTVRQLSQFSQYVDLARVLDSRVGWGSVFVLCFSWFRPHYAHMAFTKNCSHQTAAGTTPECFPGVRHNSKHLVINKSVWKSKEGTMIMSILLKGETEAPKGKALPWVYTASKVGGAGFHPRLSHSRAHNPCHEPLVLGDMQVTKVLLSLSELQHTVHRNQGGRKASSELTRWIEIFSVPTSSHWTSQTKIHFQDT